MRHTRHRVSLPLGPRIDEGVTACARAPPIEFAEAFQGLNGLLFATDHKPV
jgi:hypothetical protein